MPSVHWIKFYTEIIDDPKMGRLSDHLWRRAGEFFLLAGTVNDGGKLPAVEDMAWKLRATSDEIAEDLQELAYVGIILFVDGLPVVKNFQKRQEPSDPTAIERMKRWRERNVTDNVTRNVTRNADSNVTQPLRVDTETESDTESDTETETESKRAADSDPFFVIQRIIETSTGYPIPMTPPNIKTINEFIELGVTEDDIKDGIAFLVGVGKIARDAVSLKGSVKTSHAKRVQAGNGRKPSSLEDQGYHRIGG